MKFSFNRKELIVVLFSLVIFLLISNIVLSKIFKHSENQKEKTELILNFVGIEGFETGAIGAIVAINSKCKEMGIEMSITNPPEELLKLIKITNLSEVLKLSP